LTERRKKKLLSHAFIRGVELELLRVPLAGYVVYIGEMAVFATAAMGIVFSIISEWIFSALSVRFTPSISPDDLGDPNVLGKFISRIDYLAEFLIPMGMYILSIERMPKNRIEMRIRLEKLFEILKMLEHRSIRAINFYRMALISNRVAPAQVELVESCVKKYEPLIRYNTFEIARKCFGVLLTNGFPGFKKIPIPPTPEGGWNNPRFNKFRKGKENEEEEAKEEMEDEIFLSSEEEEDETDSETSEMGKAETVKAVLAHMLPFRRKKKDYEVELPFEKEKDYEGELPFEKKQDYEVELPVEKQKDYEVELPFEKKKDYEVELPVEKQKDYEVELPFEKKKDYEVELPVEKQKDYEVDPEV